MTSNPRQWTHPDWSGETVFILGGGPSLKDVDPADLSRYKVIAVNEAGLTFYPEADILYWADTRWVQRFENINRLHLHKGPYKYTSADWSLDEIPGVRFITTKVWRPAEPENAFIFNPQFLGGFDGGSRCINLAYHCGARRVFLLGFDMHDYPTDTDEWKKGNFHDAHPLPPLENQRTEKFLPAHEAMAERLKRLALMGGAGYGVRDFSVYNLTPGSALTCWPKARLEDVK